MSIWSKLAKIGGYAAAPFTAGASIPIGHAVGSALEGVGKAAGGASQAMASNRGTRAEQTMDQNASLESQLLAREQEKRSAQGNAYQNAIRADMANNWRPAHRPAGTPNISFGAGLSDAGKGASQAMFRQSMDRLGAPDLQDQSGMPAYRNLANDKDFKKTMSPGIMERIMGYGSVLAPIAGMYMNRGSSGVNPDGTLASRPTVPGMGTLPSGGSGMGRRSIIDEMRERLFGGGSTASGGPGQRAPLPSRPSAPYRHYGPDSNAAGGAGWDLGGPQESPLDPSQLPGRQSSPGTQALMERIFGRNGNARGGSGWSY